MSTDQQSPIIPALEARFRELTLLLYDTSVPPERLDAEVLAHLAPDVRFVDPWQDGRGREKYRLGAAGFHCMFKFDFHILQLHVQLDEATSRGRALVDGVMNLKQLEWLYTFPLRTILVYEFSLTPARHGEAVGFVIHTHEEMWSYADLIASVPFGGRLYGLFRRAFGTGFLAASYLSCRARRLLPRAL